MFRSPEDEPQFKENFITYDLEKNSWMKKKRFWISNTYKVSETQQEIHQQLPQELIQKMKLNKHLLIIKVEPYTKIKLGYSLKKDPFNDELLKHHSSSCEVKLWAVAQHQGKCNIISPSLIFYKSKYPSFNIKMTAFMLYDLELNSKFLYKMAKLYPEKIYIDFDFFFRNYRNIPQIE